jgi:rhomboid protease GluP
MTPNTDNPGPPPKTPEQKEKWWKYLIPTKQFFFTPLIIDINILLFLLMVITSGKANSFIWPDSVTMLKWGAMEKTLILTNHEWWRLVTSVVGHFGIIHLAVNMYALLYIGLVLEPLLGKERYIASYLATGIISGLASLWWHNNSVGAGASGAIFGMYGVFFALLTTNLIEKSVRKPLFRSIGIFIVYNLAFGASVGVVDNAAHIGGLLSGMLIGYIIYASLKVLSIRNSIVTAVAIVLLSIAAAYITIPRLKPPVDVFAAYNNAMKNFSVHQEKAMYVYNLPKETPDSILLKLLQTEGLPNWIKCKNDVAQLDSIDLPAELQKSRERIDRYIDFRIKSANLQIARLKEGTHRYDTSLDSLQKEIDKLINESNDSTK